MVSTSSPWHLLREQLMQIEETMIPSAPFVKDDGNHHWIEFDIDVFLGEKMNKSIGCGILVNALNHSIVITNVLHHYDGLLHPFDVILLFNDINFTNISQQTAQCIINAHQGKQIKIRIRRLQPPILETIQFNFQKDRLFNSGKFGCMITGGIGQTNSADPGIFIVGITSNSRAAKSGRLRIGDRLMQISDPHTTVNLQCIEFNYALKLIARMRNESTSITLVVAHQT